jgi:hypothetical protein
MTTSKQSRAIMIYKRNYGSGITPTEAMRRAGYAESSLKNPKVLTESEDWKTAMDRFLPDIELLEKHADLMKAKTIVRADFPVYIPHDRIKEIIEDAGCQVRNYETNPITGIISVWYWAPDTRAQTKALELAYKLKGKMQGDVNINLPPPVAMVEFIGGEPTAPSQDPVS